jgi:putative PIN family toxin of toxin-antitoxin system
MLRVVIDTDVLVAAFLSPEGASRQLILDALDKKFALLLSTSLLLEYESVLRRPQHLARAAATEADVTEILDALAGICVPVVFDYNWRPTGAHADDELVIGCAGDVQSETHAGCWRVVWISRTATGSFG